MEKPGEPSSMAKTRRGRADKGLLGASWQKVDSPVKFISARMWSRDRRYRDAANLSCFCRGAFRTTVVSAGTKAVDMGLALAFALALPFAFAFPLARGL